ncbi:hypothetical protein C8J57DRAFT_1247433 [Mycena rebaudengoi]|nr:hypothetical protein C8J57DRAFT_1247433 [Mycena rebaudengoi]
MSFGSFSMDPELYCQDRFKATHFCASISMGLVVLLHRYCDALAHYIQRSAQVDLVFHFKVLPSATRDRHAILPGDKLIKLWARCFELSHLFSADADRSLWSWFDGRAEIWIIGGYGASCASFVRRVSSTAQLVLAVSGQVGFAECSVLTGVISALAAPARDTSTSAAERSVADASVEADAYGAPNADWGGALESDAPTAMSEATAVASMVVLAAGALESAEERAADAESEEAGTAAASMMAVTALKLEGWSARIGGGNDFGR